jgi:hypothetical protein
VKDTKTNASHYFKKKVQSKKFIGIQSLSDCSLHAARERHKNKRFALLQKESELPF